MADSHRAASRDPDPDRAAWLEASRGIAAHLCGSARWHGDACHWVDPGRGTGATGADASSAASGRLELGSAGVALFLLRLHGEEADEGCLRTARGALAHALEREAAAGVAPGWYAGTAGVAAACAELGARTGDGRWLDDALSLCRLLERVPAPVCDVAAGDAGSVLGLLGVHGATDDGRTLEAAVRLGDRLLARRRREADGISWSESGGALSRNLLGLPHGAGGIGLALLELHRATGEARFLAGAVQALRYEDACFDPGAGDWPDLRHPELSRHAGPGRLHRLRRAAAEDALPGPSIPRPSPTWRDGTPGIALVRACFAGATGAEAYRVGRAHALTRCREHLARPGGEETLALGRFGCADALLECARRAGGRTDARAAADVAREAIERGGAEAWRALPAGLLHGSAGIGMFLLRLAAPGVASPLLPVSSATQRIRSCGEEEVARAALEGAREHFARTEKALATLGVPLPLSSGPVSPAEHRARLDALVQGLPDAERGKVGEAFALESLAHRLLSEHADRSGRLAAALLRPRPELLEQPDARVRLAATARVFRAAYDWEPLLRGEAGVADLDPAPGLYLVHDTPGGTVARRLDGGAAEVVASLEAGVRVDELLADVVSGAGDQPGDAAGEEAGRARVLRILRQAYELGIVEIDDPHGLRPSDVTSELCTRCGECCHVRLYLTGDASYRDYVAAALEEPLRAAYPAMTIGHERSGGEDRVVLDLGHCHNLRQEMDESGRASFHCGIYETRPEVCRTFNCVSWWRMQRVNATGRTASDAVIEKVATLRKELGQ